ncbi:Gfo/Idh/MocA family oxidoreductase [Sorangium sp. So ce861]|uniref:Gfo/Idh/MocA family oxidoreductase n=1 Tax=Sorangium sp. So ce861 TaxID=3133323 RepID=UPI003F6345DC
MGERRRVVVCGTRFGEHYLAALRREHPRYALAGILARGSGRSRALAERLGVPLYRDVGELPPDIDAACVVVRSAIVGGQGSDLARALLSRGIHVLQEHPVHPTDIVRLREIGAARGARYHVSTFYAHAPAGRRFIDYAAESAGRRRPAFVEITTSLQLLYSSLDLVGRALGSLSPFASSLPLSLDGLPSPPGPWPFRSLQGVLGGVPFSLHLQAYLDLADPDHHSLVMHRIAIGGPEGHVLLASSFGPVVWSHSIYAPDYGRDDADASYLVAPERHAGSRWNRRPTAVVLGAPGGPSLTEAAERDFPQAVWGALDELTGDVVPAWQRDDYWQAHGRAWLGIMRAVGQPQVVALGEPPEPYPDPALYAGGCGS